MLWYVVLLPLIGAILNGLVLRNVSKNVSHIVGASVMLAAFGFTLVEFMQSIVGQDPANLPVFYHGFEWINAAGLEGTAGFEAPFKLAFDRLSAFMCLIITGIGSLIHIYAGGYMHEEVKTSRFFAYLNLFVFMMLLLVLGDNLLVMFVGWEGVGLCSYLLIGYWFSEDANAAAGMKAFIVNRIGDLGFLFGIFLTYKYFGTISFSQLKPIFMDTSLADATWLHVVPWITLCLFVGVCGKSAQIPLYVWLPDAMAGPTPVSALIHAATMVTAGVYMMSRLSFMYFFAPTTMAVVAIVGALTAFFAATIALTQTDIKKVLAYSTVSQLGYMVLGCGVGAFGAGVFHLFTHACFKALLFLGAGSVIVAMHHKQEMGVMGGLRKHMPKTHIAFLFGVLAIIGTPGLSGFFSKDEILWHAFLSSPILWGIGTLAAALTAFYMVRLYCLTFLGENRADHHTQEHLHETPALMWAPLWVLALLSIAGGWIGIPEVLGGSNMLHHYFEPVFQMPAAAAEFWAGHSGEHSHALELGLMATSVGMAAIAAIVSFNMYRNGPSKKAAEIATRFQGAYKLLLNKYFVDEFYFARIVTPVRDMSEFLYKVVDVKIVDGLVNAVGQFMVLAGGTTSFKMSGSLHRYGMVFIIGIICLLSIVVF
jgi:NADH-quinone oxidoreductase subunit L